MKKVNHIEFWIFFFLITVLGENYFQFIYKSSDSLVIYGENVDDKGKVTLVTELLGMYYSLFYTN